MIIKIVLFFYRDGVRIYFWFDFARRWTDLQRVCVRSRVSFFFIFAAKVEMHEESEVTTILTSWHQHIKPNSHTYIFPSWLTDWLAMAMAIALLNVACVFREISSFRHSFVVIWNVHVHGRECTLHIVKRRNAENSLQIPQFSISIRDCVCYHEHRRCVCVFTVKHNLSELSIYFANFIYN